MGELLRCKYTCRLLSEAGETGGGAGTKVTCVGPRPK